MKKLGKILMFGTIGLVLIVVIGLIVAFAYIDSIAKTGIERGATYALAVDTTVDSVNVGVMSGQFSMEGLTVDNPEGFDKGEHFVTLGKGEMAVTLGSLMEDRVEVPTIKLDNIDMVLEKKGDTSNYETILENLKRFEKQEEEKPESEEGKKFVVNEIVITNVMVHAYLFQVGNAEAREVKVPIDEIRMKVDSDEGITVQEMTDLIIKTVLTSVVQNAGSLLPGLMADSLSEGLNGLNSLTSMGIDATSEIGGKVSEVTGSLIEGLGGATEGVGDSVKDVTKGVGDVTKGISEGLGGLLGGKKDEAKDETDGSE